MGIQRHWGNMVATSEPPTSNTSPRNGNAPASFDSPRIQQYTTPYDTEAGGKEGTPTHGQQVPLSFHESFKTRSRLSSAQRRELLIKQTEHELWFVIGEMVGGFQADEA